LVGFYANQSLQKIFFGNFIGSKIMLS